jgi:hypothetical protein
METPFEKSASATDAKETEVASPDGGLGTH